MAFALAWTLHRSRSRPTARSPGAMMRLRDYSSIYSAMVRLECIMIS